MSGFWKGRRALVTGGAGFIGSYLTELLVAEGAEVTVADNLKRGSLDRIESVAKRVQILKGDLTDPRECAKACKGQEVVLNLAAKVTGIEYNRFHMADMFEANMLLQMNVLKAASDAGVKRFLQVSTACVYPHDAKVPTPESEGGLGAPEPTNEGYGYAKLMGEKLAKYYARETKMEVPIARPFNAYGPRDHFDEATSHVIPAILKRVLDGDEPVTIWGSGNQSRVFVHARDVARGMMLLAEKGPSAEPINVGHDAEVTIKELFRVICEVAGRNPKPFYDTSKPDGYPRRAADVSRLRQVTGFVPSVTLKDGIREMHAWFAERPPAVAGRR